MKIDQLVIKRLNELGNKAIEVSGTISETEYGSSINPEKFQEWAISVLNVLKSAFGENSVHYENFKRTHENFNGWGSKPFIECKGIFNAAKEDYEGGYIFTLRSLISAEILDNVLEQAKELLQYGYKDPACVVTGIALETTLKDLCNRNGLTVGKMDKMNADLCKLGLYNVGMQKQIIAWADRRNNSAHGKWDAYTSDDVKDMIAGVNRFIAEYL